jgi:hypothetical protein
MSSERRKELNESLFEQTMLKQFPSGTLSKEIYRKRQKLLQEAGSKLE